MFSFMVFLFLIGKYLLYNNVTVVLLNSVNDTTSKEFSRRGSKPLYQCHTKLQLLMSF